MLFVLPGMLPASNSELPVISKIVFEPVEELDTNELQNIIKIQAGEVLDYKKLDESIRTIYKKGIFKSVSVWTNTVGSNVEITFALRMKDIISAIYFTGNEFVSTKKLLRNITLIKGTPFYQKELLSSADILYDLYRNLGFFNVHIAPGIQKKDNKLDIKFDIKEGKRVEISDVAITGELGILEDEILKILSYSGEFYETGKIKKGIEKAILLFHNSGFWSAIISDPNTVYNSEENTLKLMIDIKSGPRYQLDFSGNKVFSREELLEVVSYKNSEPFILNMIDGWNDNLKNFYQANGFARASITYKIIEKSSNEISIIFYIDESNPARIMKIVFEGNEFFTDKKLKNFMLTKTRGPLKGTLDFLYDWVFDYYPKGILIYDRLKDDVENLEFLYKRHGFLDAKIKLKSIEYPLDDSSLIPIVVNEGTRTIVREVQFEGNNMFSENDLRKNLPIKEGEALDPWKIDEALKSLKEFYNNKGFIFVTIENMNEFMEDNRDAIVKFLISEGPLAIIKKINLSGNKMTKGYVVRRELKFHENEIMNYPNITLSQQKLYRLGFIDRAAIDITKVHSDGGIDLEVKIKEKPPRRIDFRFGYGTAEGLRSSLEISHKNLFGRGQTIFLRTDASYWLMDLNPLSDIYRSKDNYFNTRVINLGFRWSWLFRQDIDFSVNYINQERKRIYELSSNDLILGVEKDLTRHYHGGSQYQARLRHPLTNTPDIRFEDKRRLGLLRLFLFHDTRNSPFEPSRGHLQTYQIDYASRYFIPEGEYDYLRLFLRGDFYYAPLKKLIAALSVRTGYGYVIGNGDLPIEERFFLGGTTSVRGFEEDSLGSSVINQKDGKLVPAGGDLMLGYNFELRFPLTKNFGFALFTDGGNVWQKADDTTVDGIITFRDIRESAGVGLRYITPIGPLRLDLGLKLDRRPDEPLNEWHFFLGNAF